MDAMPARPMPLLDEPESAVFWRATERRELRYQRCTECAVVIFPARSHCSHCAGVDLEWLVSAGAGTLHTCTTTREHSHPYFKARAPYTIGLIDLDEGFRMLAELSPDGEQLAPGARVHVTWEQHDQLCIPVFAPGERSGEGTA